jgi:transposase
MKNDARKYTTEEKALLRRIAVQRVFDGESPVEVTRSLGLGDKTIFIWLRKAKKEGLDALSPIPRSGRNRALNEIQEQEVKRWVLGGDPRQNGLDYSLWNRQIVADLVDDRFSISLSLTAVGNLLRRLGLTPQKPLQRAYERDESAVIQWQQVVYPEIVKNAKKQRAEIVWLDEAVIRFDGPLQQACGLKDQEPVVKTTVQQKSINAISVLNNKGGFWYHIYSGRFDTDKVIDCLNGFMKYRRKKVFLIMESHAVHKSKKVKQFVISLQGKVSIYLLPPYAPDLDPDELVWNQTPHVGTTNDLIGPSVINNHRITSV